MTAQTYPFELPPLTFAPEALEPYLDARTMSIHHDEHHRVYVERLNAALKDHPGLHGRTIENLLRNLNRVPPDIRPAVRNNGGGHYNHTLFWKSLKKDAAPLSEGPLMEALGRLFPDADTGKQEFLTKALSVFGSGWVWLSVDKNNDIVLETTPNQDTPLAKGNKPLFGLDVWEHAYYLKYQNRRNEYVQACMGIINWPFLEDRFEKLTA